MKRISWGLLALLLVVSLLFAGCPSKRYGEGGGTMPARSSRY